MHRSRSRENIQTTETPAPAAAVSRSAYMAQSDIVMQNAGVTTAPAVSRGEQSVTVASNCPTCSSLNSAGGSSPTFDCATGITARNRRPALASRRRRYPHSSWPHHLRLLKVRVIVVPSHRMR